MIKINVEEFDDMIMILMILLMIPEFCCSGRKQLIRNFEQNFNKLPLFHGLCHHHHHQHNFNQLVAQLGDLCGDHNFKTKRTEKYSKAFGIVQCNCTSSQPNLNELKACLLLCFDL